MDLPKSLFTVSETIGSNKILVQGPGGNISYKVDDDLFIKASGENLIDSNKKNIFIKTNLKKIRIAIENNSKDPLKGTWNENLKSRPSIETTLHALMPHKCVLHVHCVNTLSWVIQNNFENKIYKYLKGINWESIPYKKPGYELSKELKKVFLNKSPDVIFLSNHGFVAGANSPNQVQKLVQNISNRLNINTTPFHGLNIEKINKIKDQQNFKLPKYNHVHSLAFSEISMSIISKGILFPDQLVFIDSKFIILNNLEEIDYLKSKKEKDKLIIIVKNIGVFLPIDLSIAAEEILYGLSLLVERIPPKASINYLTKEEELELLDWDAEKHRKSINC